MDGVVTGCKQAMRVVKEPLSGSTFVGPFYFLMNDWQIRPMDTPHELVIIGSLVQDISSSKNVLKLDDLASVVAITRLVAVEVQTTGLSAGGLTLEESGKLTKIESLTKLIPAML